MHFDYGENKPITQLSIYTGIAVFTAERFTRNFLIRAGRLDFSSPLHGLNNQFTRVLVCHISIPSTVQRLRKTFGVIYFKFFLHFFVPLVA